MPNTKSAKKALRQNLRRRLRNLAKKRQIKSALKDYRRALQTADFATAEEKLRLVSKALDKAAKTRTIAKNKANRLKSRLSLRLHQARLTKS